MAKGRQASTSRSRKLRMQQRINNTYCVFLPPVINHLLQYFDRGSTCLLVHECHLLKMDTQVKLSTGFFFFFGRSFITPTCTIKSQNSSVKVSFTQGLDLSSEEAWLLKIWVEFDIQPKFCNNLPYTLQLISHASNWINQNRLGVHV